MAENSLFPAFVKIYSHSAYAPHVNIIPTTEYHLPDGSHATGYFERHSDGSAVGAGAMVEELVTDMLPFFKATTVFDNWTVFTMDSPTARPLPVFSAAFDSFVGTSASTTWAKAVEHIFTFRTEAFGIMKLVLLDAPSGNSFDKTLDLGGSGAAFEIASDLSNPDNAWSGRDGSLPLTFLQFTTNINQKLRKSYRMT